MMVFVDLWLFCLAVFLVLVEQAPVIDEVD